MRTPIAIGVLASAMLLVAVPSATASISVSSEDGHVMTFSTVDTNGADVVVPFYPSLGVGVIQVWTGTSGGEAHSWIPLWGRLDVYPVPTMFFLDAGETCDAVEPEFLHSDEDQQGCWLMGISHLGERRGVFGPGFPPTATGTGGTPLVFDHWNASDVGEMQPVNLGQPAGTSPSGYCHSGDRGLFQDNWVGFRNFVDVSTGVGTNASIQAVYAPASPDTSPPIVTVDVLLDCSTFGQNSDVSSVGYGARYSFRCDDPGSGVMSGPTGIAGCVGTVNGTPVADGSLIDTSQLGTYTLTVTGTDGAGHTTVRHATYTVVAPPKITDYAAPAKLTKSPFTVSFDRPVNGIATSNLVVRDETADQDVAGSLSCLDASDAAVDCGQGPVSTVHFMPSGSLTAGARYSINVDDGTSGVVGSSDSVQVQAFSATVQAQTDLAYNDYPIRTKWATVKDPGAYDGSYLQERSAGATRTFSYEGSASVCFRSGPSMGIVKVKVTGGGAPATTQSADTYSATPGEACVNLPGEFFTHKVLLTVTGTRNPASTGANVGLDRIFTGASGDVATKGSLSDGPGNGYYFSGQKGASITLPRVYGSELAWNVVIGPNGGKAKVLIDGVKVATEDLYAPTYSNPSFVYDTDLGYHSIKIVVTGTKSRASDDTIVRSRGFSVLSDAQG